MSEFTGIVHLSLTEAKKFGIEFDPEYDDFPCPETTMIEVPRFTQITIEELREAWEI